MNVENELGAIEITIDQAQELVKASAAVKRLVANPDFKEVIEEGYFKDNGLRLIFLKADLTYQEPEKQKDLDRKLDAIAQLREYLTMTISEGTGAARSIAEHEKYREELLAEKENSSEDEFEENITADAGVE